MVNLHGSLRQDPRGGIREVLEVGGTLVRGGSDPGLVRAGEVAVRPVRRSACSLPASLAAEGRGTPAREARPRSGVPARRMLRVTREYFDPRRRARVRHTVLGRERSRAAGRGSGATLSASLASATFAASPSHPNPAPSAPQQPSAAHTSTAHTSAAPTASTSTGQETRPRRYRRGVAGLAAVLRRDDRRAPLRHTRRRQERDPKSRKYVADSAGGRHLRPPPLWRPSGPPPDPVKPRGGSCCCCCPTSMGTTPCSALVLLPLHLLLLLTLVACLLMGAFVFQALEGPGGGGEGAVEVSHSAIVLPGTPRDPLMTKTREEVVDRLLNASLTLVLHRSLDVIISTVFSSRKLQAALKAFEQAGGGPLPTEKEVERFGRALMTEWRHELYGLTARYHALVVRHAHGFKVGPAERQVVWDSEEPPPPLPWSLPVSLVYSFCLVTTTGGLHAATEAGRAAGVFYSLIGVLIYVGVVVVWAARLGATLTLLFKLCARRKQANSTGRKGKGGTSPYHKMHSHPSQPSPPMDTPSSASSEHTAGRVSLLFLLLFVYILGVGAQVLGGDTYWAGLENAIYALMTIRPPRPLPQSVPRVLGYLVFTLCGHLLLGLFLYSFKELCVRWWRLWGRTS